MSTTPETTVLFRKGPDLLIRVFLANLIALLIVNPASAATTVDGMTYSITSVSRPTAIESFGDSKEPSGEFIVVKLTVSNHGKKAADLSSSDFHLKRGDTQFDADSGVTVDGEFFLTKLNPGTSKSGVLVFDVPAHTAPAKYQLEVYGNGAEGSSDSKLISL